MHTQRNAFISCTHNAMVAVDPGYLLTTARHGLGLQVQFRTVSALSACMRQCIGRTNTSHVHVYERIGRTNERDSVRQQGLLRRVVAAAVCVLSGWRIAMPANRVHTYRMRTPAFQQVASGM